MKPKAKNFILTCLEKSEGAESFFHENI